MSLDNKTGRKGRGRLLWRLLEGSRRYFAFGIFLGWMMSLLDLVNPRIISYTVDTVLGDAAADLPDFALRLVGFLGGPACLKEHLWIVAGAIVTVALLSVACRWGFRMMNARGQESLLKHTRDLLYGHIERLPLTWHSSNRTGDIIQRCTSDVETVRAFLSDQLVTLIRTAVQIVLALYFMIGVSPRLSIITAVFIPVVVAFSVFFHRGIEKSFEKVDAKEGELSSVAQENLTGVRVVRAFGREKYERDRFEKTNSEYTGMWDRLMKLLSAFWATGDALSGLQRLLILFIGGAMAIGEQLSVGKFIAFVSYAAMLEWPVRSLGRVIAGMSRAGVSIDRIRYILDSAREDTSGDTSGCDFTGDVVFDNVTFGYAGDMEVLRGVSFTAAAGKTTGILGTTGSGKSTLMYLLCRLYDPAGGRITVGGRDISALNREYVRRNVGIVMQEPFLFSRTLSENIGIGLEKNDIDLVRQAARTAVLDETAMKFAKGYDTFVGERGVTLSGGQKQRAAIAQTLVLSRPVLLMDDSLSAVDTRTDTLIRDALDRAENRPTRIIISHRITTLMNADRIVVMDRGRVVEEGTHAQLYAMGGMYRRICDLQSPEGMERMTGGGK